MKMIEVTVADIVDETDAIKSIRFVRSDGAPLGRYQAGAHVDVVGPTAITRQYSLCSTPDDPESYTVAVKREEKSRGGSVALHELKVGDRLQISEPRNLMRVDLTGSHHVLMAAGIGITPMLSMARWLHVHGHSFELHYFARSTEEAAFLPLLLDRCPDQLHTHLGLQPEEHHEVLSAALQELPEGSHVYVCGPGVFMDAVRSVAEGVVGADRVHQESFTAEKQPPASENEEFTVEFEGESYQVPPDRSIVEVLRENGADVDTSCQEGICGTCIMTVLEGVPEHRDNVLTRSEKEAGETMAICVSRARTPKLVLDYF